MRKYFPDSRLVDMDNNKNHISELKKLQKSKECLILIKSHASSYKKIETIIKKLHNYEVPEIISIKINQGLNEYLKWIKNETN